MTDGVARRTVLDTVKQYSKRLFGFIRQRVDTTEDAEDILQDVWQQLSGGVDLDEIEQMGSWLYRVARNKIIDRQRKKTPELLDDSSYEDEDGEEFGLKDILLAETTTPEDENLKQLFWQQLFDALDELPEAQRYVFVQNELEDRTLQEIADETGENIKTLISRKGYAVKHLRKRLESLYHEFRSY